MDRMNSPRREQSPSGDPLILVPNCSSILSIMFILSKFSALKALFRFGQRRPEALHLSFRAGSFVA